MNYRIHMTATAERDIMQAVDYIEFTLKNRSAADNLLDAVTVEITALSDMPERFRVVTDPVLSGWGIRYVIINHYLAFYTIDESEQVVCLVRFLYERSNWAAILRQGFSLK